MLPFKSKKNIKFSIAKDNRAIYTYKNNHHSPLIPNTADGLMPLERAYFLTGNPYTTSQQKNYNPDYYLMNTDGTIIIYYENIRIIKLTPADASTVNINLTALANSYINFMKQVFNQ